MTRKDDIRTKALQELQRHAVLMLNGHFDFGNGYHGRVYLNPHQLFRHPSTIWLFAQDLLEARQTAFEFLIKRDEKRVAQHNDLIKRARERMIATRLLHPGTSVRQMLLLTKLDYLFELED